MLQNRLYAFIICVTNFKRDTYNTLFFAMPDKLEEYIPVNNFYGMLYNL